MCTVRGFIRCASLALLFNLAPDIYAQNVDFDRARFPNRREELREAVRKLDAGSDMYESGRREFDDQKRSFLAQNKYYPVSVYDFQKAGNEHFRNAIAPLTEAHKFNPENAKLNYMLGFIWFNINPAGKEALSYFEKAWSLNAMNTDSDLSFWLAWCYQLNSSWDDALRHYQGYLKMIQAKPRVSPALVDEVRKKIYECENGKKFSAHPERVFVDNLGSGINSSNAEYGPSITTDEATIIFTSRRPNSTGGKKDDADGGFFEDVYSSNRVNGKWQTAKPLSRNVNTEGHDAAAGLSPDGTKLYIYRHSGSDGGDLYESILFGLDWEVPVHMNKNINTRAHESSVSLSYDGKRLYFVSDKESGHGDRDIYFCDMDINGEWGLSRNVGPEINTRYAEEGVFMHPDGVSLYFSSKGHNSMGGYDIFRTSFQNGKWQTPVNLGYPINGPDDDVFFVVSGSGNRAYFASTKQDGFGEKDIYKITFLGPEKQPLLNTQDQLIATIANPVSNLKTENAAEVKSARLTVLKGIIADEKTDKPVEATIELIDNETSAILASFKSNKASGRYLVTLPSGHNYGVIVKAPNYLFHSENILLPEAAEYQEFTLDVDLKRLEVGNTVVLKNIFYDTDKSTIRPESGSELNRLIKLLKDNPSVKIEISSHTDDVGSDEYNMKLSESRSRTVVDFLISRGVSASRVASKGYGETQPIAGNETEDGRQKNRRTEFKITSK